MNSTQTVLVYDDAVETSEVLAAVYQPRGFTVERRLTGNDAVRGAMNRSTVVVLRSGAVGSIADQTRPLSVVIGRTDDGTPATSHRRQVAACRMSSLFDYRELVSAIDRLLCGSD